MNGKRDAGGLLATKKSPVVLALRAATFAVLTVALFALGLALVALVSAS
ncbi:MAG: hypothetical protein KC933_14715 [Myxococcales bacterium]|nr:hypothetical protein [Myxococcales bacterium]